MDQFVIIVAGGQGLRMGSEIPKQFLKIDQKPILQHTVEKFLQALPQAVLVLVLPKTEINRWSAIADEPKFKEILIVEGGNNRFESVKAGLSKVTNGALVAIHDGVRPLVSVATINRCITEAQKTGAAIPVVELKDSIRRLNKESSVAEDRRNFRLVQTPQCFYSDWLKEAYQQKYDESFTDDASVIESIDKKISLVQGNDENIKITNPFDLLFAENILRQEKRL